MAEHFSKSTVQATFWCPKCRKDTPHHVCDGRRGGCMVCIENQKPAEKAAPKPAPQEDLFG